MQILFGEIVLLGRLDVNFGVEWGQRDDGFLLRFRQWQDTQRFFA